MVQRHLPDNTQETPAGFKPTIPAGKQLQTLTLYCSAIDSDFVYMRSIVTQCFYHSYRLETAHYLQVKDLMALYIHVCPGFHLTSI